MIIFVVKYCFRLRIFSYYWYTVKTAGVRVWCCHVVVLCSCAVSCVCVWCVCVCVCILLGYVFLASVDARRCVHVFLVLGIHILMMKSCVVVYLWFHLIRLTTPCNICKLTRVAQPPPPPIIIIIMSAFIFVEREISSPRCATSWESFQSLCKCLNEQNDNLKSVGQLFQIAVTDTAKSLLVLRTNIMVSAERGCCRPEVADTKK